MVSKKQHSTHIEEYIAAAPASIREKLLLLHHCIREEAPGAAETLKWRMPAYSFKKILVTWAVHKKHIGFYPMPSVLKAFTKDLAKFETGEGSIRFPLEKPLPLALIRKIVRFRVKESKEGVIKWRE